MARAAAPSAPAHAPWKAELQERLNKNMGENKASINYSIATLAREDDGGIVPRVRTVVHRGFLNERRKSDPPNSSSNREDQESSHLVFVTDVRSPKVRELLDHQGKIEINWWLPVSNDQFRFRGKAHVVPAPKDIEIKSLADPAFHQSLWKAFPASRLAPGDGFDWEQERLRHFRKLKPDLRASFTRSSHPGTTLPPSNGASDHGGEPAHGAADDYSKKTFETSLEPLDPDQAKDEEQKALVQESLNNFALVVIEVTELDLAELSAEPSGVGRRTRWTLRDGQWTGTRIAP